MTIITEFTGTENYAERMAGLEAIHDWWFGAGSFAAAATLGQVRANLNTILVGSTILNRETFATWLAKVNTLNEPTEYAAALTFGEGQSGALWQCTLPASLRAATDGIGEAAIGGTIARINDASGNALHLTQATASLRPIRGRRPKTGVRNLLRYTEDVRPAPWAVQGGAVRLRPDVMGFSGTGQSLYQPRAIPGGATVGMVATFSADLSGSGMIYMGVSRSTGGAYEDSKVAITLTETPTRYVVSHTIANPGQVGFSGFVGTGTDGTAMEVTVQRAQLELGGAATPYQAVGATSYDVVEDGVEPVTYAGFDLVDDALTTGGFAGGLAGQAFVAGDGGCYLSDLSVAAGGTFTIGGVMRGWTGAAPGILRAVTGNTGRVLDALIREGSYTEDEIARLERYYRAFGGKGLLVADGENLWSEAGYTLMQPGISDLGGGGIGFATVGSGSIGWTSGKLIVGAAYIVSLVVSGWEGGIIIPPYSGDHPPAVSADGAYERAFVAGGTNLYMTALTAATATVSDISVRRLINREDL